jgi:hydrogenase maturation protease
MNGGPAVGWEERLRKLIGDESSTVHLIGVGNPLRQDDSVGLYVIRLLRGRGRKLGRHIVVHPPSTSPERELSRVDCTRNRVVLFDAVEANSSPGTVVFAGLGDSRYGYFATHNIPLRLLPNVSGNTANVYIAGVQPMEVGVGEGLSEVVREAAGKIAEVVRGQAGKRAGRD